VRLAHNFPTQEGDAQPAECSQAQQQGVWSPGSPQSQEVSARPAGQPRAQDEDARPAERQSAEEQSAVQSDDRRDPVAPGGSAGAAAGPPGSARLSAEATEAAEGGAAAGHGGPARLSAGGPAAAPLRGSPQSGLESGPGASLASGQQTAGAGGASVGAWAADGAGGDGGAGVQASGGQRAASARGAPGPQGRQPAQPPAGGSSYAPLQEGDFGYTAAKPPAVKVPFPARAALQAVSSFSCLRVIYLPMRFLVYTISCVHLQCMAAQVREKRLRRARYQEPPQAPALAADGVGAPASPMFGWITGPDGRRRVCPRCEGRGFIRSAAVRGRALSVFRASGVTTCTCRHWAVVLARFEHFEDFTPKNVEDLPGAHAGLVDCIAAVLGRGPRITMSRLVPLEVCGGRTRRSHVDRARSCKAVGDAQRRV